jgi:hypothetical protein
VKDQIEFISKSENALPVDADLGNEAVRGTIQDRGKRLEQFIRRRVRDRKKGNDGNKC